MKSTIFLSYASSLNETAKQIELSLKGEGYAVFRDRSMLPPGETFDARIHAAVEDSDLFVFLISPESVSPGRYTLTELKFAEQKWAHPTRRVLPVMVEETPKEAIPSFLRAVTILKPSGNLVAEVAAEVARLTAPWWLRMLAPRRLVPVVVAAILLVVAAWLALPAYLERRQQNTEAAELVEKSRAEANAGNHAKAWTLLEQAQSVAPASRAVFEAQEQLAMYRLRNAGLNYSSAGRAGYADLVNEMVPVLARGTPAAQGERLANLRAHTGWVEYLRGGLAGTPAWIPWRTTRLRSRQIPPTSMRMRCGPSNCCGIAPPPRSKRQERTSRLRSRPGGSANICGTCRFPRCCRPIPTSGSKTWSGSKRCSGW